jgi:hypothetical protein
MNGSASPTAPFHTEPLPPPVFHHEVEQEPSQPFDAGNFFRREPSPEQEEQVESKPTDQHIREIIRQDDPEVLEAGVQQSIKILEDFKQSFAAHAIFNPDARAWVESIERLIP